MKELSVIEQIAVGLFIVGVGLVVIAAAIDEAVEIEREKQLAIKTDEK